MSILPYVAWFFAGLFLANVVPHLVAGVQGKPFQTPFAKPSGIGLSSSRMNVVWAFLNLVLGWLLGSQVGAFNIADPLDAGAMGLGALLISLFAAKHFGALHGGDLKG